MAWQGYWYGMKVGDSAPVHLEKGKTNMRMSLGMEPLQPPGKSPHKMRRWYGSAEGKLATVLQALACSFTGFGR